jgi:hypothetical protein
MMRWLRAWRASRVLDDRQGGRAPRDQALVDALLRDASKAPTSDEPNPWLRGAVMARIASTTPCAPSPSGGRSRWLAGAMGGAALAALACGVVLLGPARRSDLPPADLVARLHEAAQRPVPMAAQATPPGALNSAPGDAFTMAGDLSDIDNVWSTPRRPRGVASAPVDPFDARAADAWTAQRIKVASELREETRLAADALLGQLPVRLQRDE